MGVTKGRKKKIEKKEKGKNKKNAVRKNSKKIKKGQRKNGKKRKAVRGKKKGNRKMKKNNLKRKNGRKNQRKTKKNQKKNKKNKKKNLGSKQRTTRTCSGSDEVTDECLENAVDVFKYLRNQVRTFNRKYARITSFNKIIGNKLNKSGLFEETAAYLLLALGGNISAASCGETT